MSLNHKSSSPLTLGPPTRSTVPSTSPITGIDPGSSVIAVENLIDLELPVVLDVPVDLNDPSEDFPEDASSRISYSLVSLPNTIAPRKSSGFHSDEEVAVNGAW